ncbi:hypothetical protein ACP4OV_010112 [Aristida adscensionis]
MESLVLAAASPRLPLLSAAARGRRPTPAAPAAAARRGAGRPKLAVSAAASSAARGPRNVFEGFSAKGFASMSTSNSNENMSTGTGTLPPVPPPSSYIGSPVFWIGIGVALSVAFSTVSSMVKVSSQLFYLVVFKCKYAMQQAFKSMMSQAPPNTFGSNSPFPPPNTFGSNSPFPFAMPPQPSPTTPSSYPYSEPRKDTSPQAATVDVSATEVEAAKTSEETDTAETSKPSKKFAFVDVSPEELQQKQLQSSLETVDVARDSTDNASKEDTEKKIPTNGASFKPNEDAARGPTESSTGASGPMLSIETIEKMMEDPAVQKMVYPYLPEEMRNPDSFKWMLQNPMYRQQLQDMLNNMGGSPDQWDNRMVDHLKNFDLSSPEVRQQFAQVGMTPEEVVSKIMANPEVAVAFQNPKIQTAIMDCSQNPLNIVKYQNDKEVMDVFMKISQIFPQING